jgi:hypothetical protein
MLSFPFVPLRQLMARHLALASMSSAASAQWHTMAATAWMFTIGCDQPNALREVIADTRAGYSSVLYPN